ncbi:uncharacterized protein PgNI_01100 [Pyricularia grisea]|uniref:DUF7492 domain-containing protein n=1 Tax=Pyricularia grisea TaxID=148305 RepID=A0A6P8BMU8_PYRGI|nr:uncharacterized protein PgNI_01100 [Pyricularia grisea]TLD17860.1 hypothetical protein PgNI_01100 [Pyricularia grisea]
MRLPRDLPTSRIYTLYWVWNWPTITDKCKIASPQLYTLYLNIKLRTEKISNKGNIAFISNQDPNNRVPLSAFIYDPFVGRGRHPTLVKKLMRVFRRTGCRPHLRENHVQGLVDARTLSRINNRLQISGENLLPTINTGGSHPTIKLKRCILCMDGQQRIAAAEKMFGLEYTWTVRLYSATRGSPHNRNPALSLSYRADEYSTGLRQIACHQMPAFSRQTKFSDGNIYYHIRKAQETKSWKLAQSYRVELTQCKEKILNQLIQHHLTGITEGYVAARSFIEALDLLLPYPGLLEGLELANWHRYLALHWDEPIVHFLSDHLYSTYELIVEGVAEARKYCDITTNLPEKLSWTLPTNPTIKAADGHVTISNMDQKIALKALFLTAIRSFPYLSSNKPKQDVRREATVANVDPGFVYLLQAEAKNLGLSSSKIEKALAGHQPIPRSIKTRDQEIYCDWKCGKPNLRAFINLQKHAFLPDLASVHGKDGLVPLFVFRDFMEAFFGNDAFMVEIEPPEQGHTGASASSFPGGTRPNVRRDIADTGAMDVDRTPEQSDGNTLPSPTDRTRPKHSRVRQKRHHPYNRAAKQGASGSQTRQRRSRSSNEVILNQDVSMSEAEAAIADRDRMQRSAMDRRKSTLDPEDTRLAMAPKPSKVAKKKPDKGKGKAKAEVLNQLLSQSPGSRKTPSQSVIVQPTARIQPTHKRPGGPSTALAENPRGSPPESPFIAPPDLGLPSIATEEENPRDRPRSPPLVAPPSPYRTITAAEVDIGQSSKTVASAAQGLPEPHIDRNPGKKRIVKTGVNTVEIRQPARTDPPLKRPRIATRMVPSNIAMEDENPRDRRRSPPFLAPPNPSLPIMTTEDENPRDRRRSPPFLAPPNPNLPRAREEQKPRNNPQTSPLAAPSPNTTDRPRQSTADRRQRTDATNSAAQAGVPHQNPQFVSSGPPNQEARSKAVGRWLTPKPPVMTPPSPTSSNQPFHKIMHQNQKPQAVKSDHRAADTETGESFAQTRIALSGSPESTS